MAELIFYREKVPKAKIQLEKTRTMIGSGNSKQTDITLYFLQYPRQFLIETHDHKWFLHDYSGKGAVVNAQRHSSVELSTGDRITAGEFEIEFVREPRGT